MSIVCAAIKNGTVAISSDTQASFGSLKISSKHLKNNNKLFEVNKSIIGVVGWHAITHMLEHLLKNEKQIFKLNSRMEIFSTLINLQEKLKDNYFINTSEEDDQPVESNQIDAIIINKFGLFEIGSYREVNEYMTFCARGSGNKIALGAMHALYNSNASAKKIVEAGVRAACEFDDSCSLPLITKSIKLL